jgi:hypothetical protein
MSAKLAQKRGTKKISIETRCRGGDEGRWFNKRYAQIADRRSYAPEIPHLDDAIEHAKQALYEATEAKRYLTALFTFFIPTGLRTLFG